MTAARILRVIARMNVGGPALQVATLSRDLDPGRFEQRLLVGSLGADECDYLELRAPDVEVVRIRGLGRSPRPSDDARALASIVAEIRRFRPHVVHTHTAKAGVLGRVAAIMGRVPLRVHTFHGHLLHGYFSPRATAGVVAIERALARVTTRLVAVGSQVRDDLLGAGIGEPSQYLVVPPGVRLPAPPRREAARTALGVPLDTPVVAFVARLTPIKRPERAVEVVLRLAERFEGLVLLVAGEGEGLADMRARSAVLGDRVRFLGWRPDVEIVYAAADLTLLTSDNEGMPVSLIEAASVGCPAVSTNVGSVREVVIDGVTGYVTDLEVSALADAASRILADPALRAQMSEAASRYAAEHFSPDRLVGDIAALYEELVEGDHVCMPS